MDFIRPTIERLETSCIPLRSPEGTVNNLPIFLSVSAFDKLKQKYKKNTCPGTFGSSRGCDATKLIESLNFISSRDLPSKPKIESASAQGSSEQASTGCKSGLSCLTATSFHAKPVSNYLSPIAGDLNAHHVDEEPGFLSEDSFIDEHEIERVVGKTMSPSFNFLRSPHSSRSKWKLQFSGTQPLENVSLGEKKTDNKYKIDTIVDYEELLKNHPSFNRYLESKIQQREASKRPQIRPKKVYLGGCANQFNAVL